MSSTRDQFSNRNKNVFVLKMERMIDRGALLSRYSRTSNLDIRNLYDKEFAPNPNRGAEFYRKVFSQYGDESIAELVTAQIGIQNISNIASKFIEESRIGLSYLEKSSRYVSYVSKGKNLYMKGEDLGFSGSIAADYDSYCDILFSVYSEIKMDLEKILRERYPMEDFLTGSDNGAEDDVLRKAYDTALHSSVLDEVRNLLPASTLTNVGISGNGRAFLNLLIKLRSSSIPELRNVSDELYEELSVEFPELINNAVNPHGMELSRYLSESKVRSANVPKMPDGKIHSMIHYENESEALHRIFTARLFASGALYGSENDFVSLDASYRKNRRQKPGRWYEFTDYTFVTAMSFGSFRDFQRHRTMSIVRPLLSPFHGYYIPDEISHSGDILDLYSKTMEGTIPLYKAVAEKYGDEMAQYAVPFGFRYPVMVKANLREICYFSELRSTPQSHAELRDLSVWLRNTIRDVHPGLAGIMKFVDDKHYVLGRFSSELKKEKKLRDI